MRRIRHFIATLTITPAGWVLVAVVPVCVLFAFLGPAGTQAPAFFLGALALGMVAMEGMGMARFGGSGGGRKNFRERREFAQRAARSSPTSNEAPVEADETAWQRERERRERKEMSSE
jgi:hypothetical protein